MIRQSETVFRPSGHRSASSKKINKEGREDSHRSSSQLNNFRRRRSTTNSWTQTSEMPLQDLCERLSTGLLHLHNYAKSLLGDFVRLYKSRK